MARGGRGAPQPVLRRDVRWFSAAILVTCVTVGGLGLAMGFYLNRAPEPVPKPVESARQDPATVPLPAAVEPAPIAIAAEPPPVPEPDPSSVVETPPSEPTAAPDTSGATVAAEPPPPPPENQVAVELAAGQPEAGTSFFTPMVARTVAMAVPPPRLTPAASYWVEYAVFSRERSAQHLRHALGALHLETSVVATHAPDGRRLWRVRSTPLDGRAGAEAAAGTARQKLAIEPLIHRGLPGRAPQAQYWVQFGAFPTKAPAIHLQQVLADNGVKATVRHTRTSRGKSLFLVRSEGFSDRKLAHLVGELGGSAAKVAFQVGRNGPMSQRGAPHGASDRAVGSSLPRHPYRPPPGG